MSGVLPTQPWSGSRAHVGATAYGSDPPSEQQTAAPQRYQIKQKRSKLLMEEAKPVIQFADELFEVESVARWGVRCSLWLKVGHSARVSLRNREWQIIQVSVFTGFPIVRGLPNRRSIQDSSLHRFTYRRAYRCAYILTTGRSSGFLLCHYRAQQRPSFV